MVKQCNMMIFDIIVRENSGCVSASSSLLMRSINKRSVTAQLVLNAVTRCDIFVAVHPLVGQQGLISENSMRQKWMANDVKLIFWVFYLSHWKGRRRFTATKISHRTMGYHMGVMHRNLAC